MTTQEAYVTMVKMWKTSNIEEIMKALNISRSCITYRASKLRKMGVNLPYKNKVFFTPELLQELNALL